jgi:uncharacterized RDD family membrane protein YckC
VITTGEETLSARQGLPAGLVSRGIANAVDAIVVLLLLVIGYLGLSAVLFMFRPRTFTFPEPGRYWSMSLGALAAAIYLAFGWYVSGRTPGKQLAGVRVVGTSGAALTFPIAAARAFLYVVFPIGFLWTAISQRSASLQDMLLHTKVVYDWRRHPLGDGRGG